jgi:6-phosphogluconolactonase (cycloisomerase 2 family)
VKVTFTPTVSGTITGALTLTDSAADSPELVALSGKGTGTVTQTVTFSPASLAFTTQQTGTSSNGKKVTLTNKGTSSLSISTVGTSGDYSETDTCAGKTIAMNGTCTITVTFTPSTIGSIKGAISVTDAAVTSPQVIALTGTGAAALGFSPSALSFGFTELGVGGSLTATLTNNSANSISISSIAVSGGYSQTNTCGTSIAAGGNCTFTVSALLAATGTLDGAITVTDSGANSPQVLSLNASGVNPPRFAYLSDNTTLNIYTVNPVTSQLRTVETIAQPAVPSTGNIYVSPSGKFLYVPVGVAVGSPIYGYSIAASSGLLNPITGSPFSSVTGAASLSFTTNGKFAFAAGTFSGSTQVESFSVNTTTGALTSIGTQPSGNPPCVQALTPNNKFLYVPDYQATGTIYAYSVNTTTGALTALAGSPFSGHPFNCGAFVHSNGKFLFVVDLATSDNEEKAPISVYSINQTTGALAEIPGSPFAGGGFNYSDFFATDPTGRFLYVAVGPSALLGYSVNLTSGALTPVPGSPYLVNYPTSLLVDPTGKFLYLSNIGSGPTAYTFSINSSTGALTQIQQLGIQGAGGYFGALAYGTAPVLRNQPDRQVNLGVHHHGFKRGADGSEWLSACRQQRSAGRRCEP